MNKTVYRSVQVVRRYIRPEAGAIRETSMHIIIAYLIAFLVELLLRGGAKASLQAACDSMMYTFLIRVYLQRR